MRSIHVSAAARGALTGVAFAAALSLTAFPAIGQQTSRVSVDSSGAQGNGDSYGGMIAANGSIVAFNSVASNLVAGDTNGTWDAFVIDRTTGITERVSVDSSGAQGDSGSGSGVIAENGTIVAFYSVATNLVAGDTNGLGDLFVHDRSTGITKRVSVDSSGNQGNSDSLSPSLSTDGRFVAFYGGASNLVSGDTNNNDDVFIHDRATGVTELVSVDSAGVQGNAWSGFPSISADGRFVAFLSGSSNLVAGDTNSADDVFVHDRSSGFTERVSVDSSGAEANAECGDPSISADGRFVAFWSGADNLVANDQNRTGDAFVHDRTTGVTERVSVDSSGNEGNALSGDPSISGDGRFVAFESYSSNLVPGDHNGFMDIFVRERASGLTTRVSVDSTGAEANSDSGDPFMISKDGLAVGFSSGATNLVAGDTNQVVDVFVHESCSTPAAWSNYGSGFPGTLGVPALTSEEDPALGATVTVDVADSLGAPTVGLLFLGFAQQSLHSAWGGDLLVVPTLVVPLALSGGTESLTGTIPFDPQLCGVAVDLQVIESDPGAARGVSFTPGLEIVLGH